MSSGKRLRSTPTFVRRGRPTQGRLKIYWLEYDLEEGSWSKATYAIQASCSSPDLIRKLESIITVESPTVLHPFRRMSWSPERRVTEAPNSELRCQGQDITNSCFESNRVSILNESTSFGNWNPSSLLEQAPAWPSPQTPITLGMPAYSTYLVCRQKLVLLENPQKHPPKFNLSSGSDFVISVYRKRFTKSEPP